MKIQLSFAAHVAFGGMHNLLDLPRPGFIILAQGRTGSTFLERLLNSHPSVRCEGEIFATHQTYPLSFITGKAAREYLLGRQWGFKAKHWQITCACKGMSGNEFLLQLQEKGWKIIYLHRENLLKTAISTIIGMEREKWVYEQGDSYTSKPFVVDPGLIRACIKSRKEQNQEDQDFLKGINYFLVKYEDSLKNYVDGSLEGLLDYLELERHPLVPSTVKTNGKSSTLELISNWDELRDSVIEMVGHDMVQDVESELSALK